MTQITITVLPEADLSAFIEGMDRATRDWTMQAARGECGWVCADCCYTFNEGMPDACAHGNSACTAIIRRDKREAMRDGNEPS